MRFYLAAILGMLIIAGIRAGSSCTGISASRQTDRHCGRKLHLHCTGTGCEDDSPSCLGNSERDFAVPSLTLRPRVDSRKGISIRVVGPTSPSRWSIHSRLLCCPYPPPISKHDATYRY
jgi:hypothetical protein